MISEAVLMDNMEYMAKFPDKYFELAIVDPSYGLPKDAVHGRGKLKSRALNAMDMSWDTAPQQSYFDELFRVSKNQMIWGGNYFKLPPTRCFVIWDKEQPFENFSAAEYCWTSFDKPSMIYREATTRTFETKIHPTQKSVKLYKYLISKFANTGDKILDTNMGSQSSRIAAHLMDFDYYGCEISDRFFGSGNKRFENAIKQTSLFTFKEQTETEQLKLL